MTTLKQYSTPNALHEALMLASNGIPTFPCMADKTPATPHGFKSATCDLRGVVARWRRYPGPLVGVPTGEASGFDVLDIDPRHDGDRWLEAERHRLPGTRRHCTRSGGLHVLFRHRTGMRNSASRIAPGVDVRGTGGYVIWWPATGLHVENPDTVAPWPNWLLDFLAPPALAHVPGAGAPTVPTYGYAAAALEYGVDAVRSAPRGRRNETLNREAFCLSRLVASGALEAQTVANELACAGLAVGLSAKEVRRTLFSAMRARGLAQ